MRFYEFEAKTLLGKQGVPLARNGTANTPDDAARLAGEIGGPVVLKSQVLSGGRMKAGGIKFADTPDEASAAAAEILKLEINGQLPRNVLVEAKANVAHEYYAGVIFDALAKRPLLIFSDMGGIDIEEVAESHPEHISRTHLSSLLPLSDYKVKEAIAALGVTGADLTGLIPIVTRLVRTFLQYGLTLAEINPLAKLDNGRFMCLEFSAAWAPIRPLYNLFSFTVIPRLGAWVARNPEAYGYLVESIRRFPDQRQFKALLEQAGFAGVWYRNLSFGIVAIHTGVRPN